LPGSVLFLAYFSPAFGDLGLLATDNVLFGLNLLLDLFELNFLGLELLVKFVTIGRLEDVLLADDLLQQGADLSLVMRLHLLAD
jgi:hypothetical protein